MSKMLALLLTAAALAVCVLIFLRFATRDSPPPVPSQIDPAEQIDDLHVGLDDLDHESWVRTHLPAESSPGFNLGLYRRRVPILFDMTGRIVHSWPEVRAIGRVRLSREGMLAVIGIDNRVKEYDWQGNLKWALELPGDGDLPHHDLIGMASGNYLILAYDPRTRADYLLEVDAGQETVWEWSMHEHRGVFPAWDESSDDPSHGNSIQELPPNRWFDAGDERFRPGNILVSARNLNTIFIIEKSTGDVVWTYSEGLDRQHEAIMARPDSSAAGLILVFNNGLESLYRYRRSLIQAINPLTMDVDWEYGSQFFFSPIAGAAQPLPGENTLITSSSGGRVLEVRPDGQIVWEWAPPFNPMRLERLPFNHSPQLTALSPPESSVRSRHGRGPYVDSSLYRFDFPFDTEPKVIDGKKRKLLSSNQGCRQLLIPPQASMILEFGFDGEELRNRRAKARFTMTLANDGEPVSILDEAMDSDSEVYWERRTVSLEAHAYDHVELCIGIQVAGPGRALQGVARWANPVIRSKSMRPLRIPTASEITEQEHRLRVQQLEAIGYVQ